MLFSAPLYHRAMQGCEQNLHTQTRVKHTAHSIGRIKITLIPPPSVPRAAEHSPEATIAAEPEEDPPVYLSGACGFLVVLQ